MSVRSFICPSITHLIAFLYVRPFITSARSLICLSNYASTARSFIFFHLYVNRLLECKLSIIQYAQMSVLPECLLILSLDGPSSRSGNSTGRIISNLFIRPSLWLCLCWSSNTYSRSRDFNQRLQAMYIGDKNRHAVINLRRWFFTAKHLQDLWR